MNGASLCLGCNQPIVWVDTDRVWVLSRGNLPPGQPRVRCDKTTTGRHERNEVAEDRVRFYGTT